MSQECTLLCHGAFLLRRCVLSKMVLVIPARRQTVKAGRWGAHDRAYDSHPRIDSAAMGHTETWGVTLLVVNKYNGTSCLLVCMNVFSMLLGFFKFKSKNQSNVFYLCAVPMYNAFWDIMYKNYINAKATQNYIVIVIFAVLPSPNAVWSILNETLTRVHANWM